jgi:hypothetical protein
VYGDGWVVVIRVVAKRRGSSVVGNESIRSHSERGIALHIEHVVATGQCGVDR